MKVKMDITLNKLNFQAPYCLAPVVSRIGMLVTFTIGFTVWFLAWQKPERAPISEKVPLREKIYLLRLIGPMLLLMLAGFWRRQSRR